VPHRRLSFSEEEFADSAEIIRNHPQPTKALQADLKIRLQRGVEEMRARNEKVPGELLDLLARL
jgi:hypothetical protein